MTDNVKQVKFSIVTPSYNQGRYLEKTILSVIEQDYPNLEYIIIDGGSTDDSVEIIKKYEKHLTYWISEKDRGQSHAINKGFEHASGDLLGWLNSDDFYAPGALKTVAEVYRADPTVGAIAGAGNMVDNSGKVLHYNPPFEVTFESLCHWVDRHFWQPSCFFTKEAWEACGPLEEKFHFAMDLDLWFKIAKKFSFALTDSLLSSSLTHENAKTTNAMSQTRLDAAFVIWGHGGEREARENLLNYVEGIQKHYEFIVKQHEGVIEQYDRDNEAMRNSLSWKVTAPLRSIYDFLKRKRSAK